MWSRVHDPEVPYVYGYPREMYGTPVLVDSNIRPSSMPNGTGTPWVQSSLMTVDTRDRENLATTSADDCTIQFSRDTSNVRGFFVRNVIIPIAAQVFEPYALLRIRFEGASTSIDGFATNGPGGGNSRAYTVLVPLKVMATINNIAYAWLEHPIYVQLKGNCVNGIGKSVALVLERHGGVLYGHTQGSSAVEQNYVVEIELETAAVAHHG